MRTFRSLRSVWRGARLVLLLGIGVSLSNCVTRYVWQHDNYAVQAGPDYTVVGHATKDDDLLLVMTNGQTLALSLLPPYLRDDPVARRAWLDPQGTTETVRAESRREWSNTALGMLRGWRGDVTLCDVSALQTGRSYQRTEREVWFDFEGQEQAFVKPDAAYVLLRRNASASALQCVPALPAAEISGCEPIAIAGATCVPRPAALWSLPLKVVLTPPALAVDVVAMPLILGGFLLWAATDRNAFR